eukprot:6694509-Prymnesium_polylepis.2
MSGVRMSGVRAPVVDCTPLMPACVAVGGCGGGTRRLAMKGSRRGGERGVHAQPPACGRTSSDMCTRCIFAPRTVRCGRVARDTQQQMARAAAHSSPSTTSAIHRVERLRRPSAPPSSVSSCNQAPFDVLSNQEAAEAPPAPMEPRALASSSVGAPPCDSSKPAFAPPPPPPYAGPPCSAGSAAHAV